MIPRHNLGLEVVPLLNIHEMALALLEIHIYFNVSLIYTTSSEKREAGTR